MMKLEFEHPYFWILAAAVPLALMVLRFTLVDSPRLQQALSFVVRAIILALLIGALAGSLWVSKNRDISLMVLADLSDSVPQSATNQLNAFLRDLSARLPKNAQAGLVTFANSPKVQAPLGTSPKFPEKWSVPETRTETAIEKTLLNAWQAMPADTVNRMVLFSDGNETLGQALDAAKRGASHGFKIFTQAYAADVKEEILLEDLAVPAEVKKGQSFSVSAIAHAVQPATATFTLYRDGFKIQEQQIELQTGANTLTFQESKATEGLTKYELRVRAEKDFYADNNVASGIVHIAGEPRVLLLERNEREARFLARSLEAENIRVEIREGKGMPGSLDELAAYDAILFSDVPATDMNVRQMNALRSYVEDLGGGFVMIGGEESFGLGGYFRTAIEEVLPVRMRSEKKKDTPSLAIMLIIDKSGSMDGEKIQLAKEAAIATVELLTDRDYVGVVAFDGDPYGVVDLQSAANKLGIAQNIEQIEAGGGTSLYPALLMAHDAITAIPATFKHVILLTDGHSQPGDFEGIVGQLANGLVTVSTVGVGEGADGELLQSMARWGRGRYYFTAEASDIPQIFTKETMSASKSSLIEEPFVPQVYRDHQVIRSIDWANAPFLFGYVVTSPKPTADVALMTERGDPLLASWRFGLGKCAAFASDAKSRWAADWLRWPGYSQFWAQLVRDVMRTSLNRGAETAITHQGGQGRIVIDNTDDSGQFVNGLQTVAQMIKPDLTVETLPLRQTAPGRYEGAFALPEIGSYLFKIRQSVPGTEASSESVFSDFTRGLTISYKPEYRHLSVNEEFLKELATVTGGTYEATLDQLLHVSEEEAVPVRKKLWPTLLMIALLLFLLDVALRRLDLAGFKPFAQGSQRYG